MIKVTDEHGIIFIKNNKKYIKTADKVNVGDILITMLGNSKVEKIEKSFETSKFVVETEDGSVFSNEIYVSICFNSSLNGINRVSVKLDKFLLKYSVNSSNDS